ncbi:MAG: TrbG/VirB9 family P-type conjugative transfer protein [Pelistega sp.]|nr:TrbG/VirB9 family P-type conjugative transfer protein [Pelistega sp.]
MTLIIRRLGVLLALLLLAACTTQADWLQKKRHYPDWEFTARQVNNYSFAWEMHGDNGVLPVQVFSTQDEVWLQFASGQVIPAIFSVDPRTQTEQILKVHNNPPYIVLKGHHSQLRLRWQDREAIVWHRPK